MRSVDRIFASRARPFEISSEALGAPLACVVGSWPGLDRAQPCAAPRIMMKNRPPRAVSGSSSSDSDPKARRRARAPPRGGHARVRRADVSSSHLHALWANYSDAPNPRCASMHATKISSPRERHACRSSAPSATPGGAGECTYNRARARRDVRNAPRCTSRAVPVRSSATVKANGSPTTAVRTMARAARCHAAGRAAARSRGQSSGPGSNQPSARHASGAAQRTRSEGRDAAASSRARSRDGPKAAWLRRRRQ